MFSEMISALQNGTLPEKTSLRKRFDAALVKKTAVIRTPPSFWSADTKINPPARQLLWAAILLLDRENARLVEAVIGAELEERQRARGQPLSHGELTAGVRRQLQEFIGEFIGLAPDESFQEILRLRAAEVFPGILPPAKSQTQHT
jgi:hypothetical protein